VKTSTARMFGVALAAASLLTTGRNLLAQSGSDELKILTTSGGGVVDIFVPETTEPGTEFSALFAPGTGLSHLQPPGALPGIIPPGLPGATYVLLSEPPTEPVDATELPPVFYVGSNGAVPIGDVLINGMGVTSGPPFVALVSDNNPDLAAYVAAIPPLEGVLTETGDLQDLTLFLNPAIFPGIGAVNVQVQSDVTTVPEPSTLALAALGTVGLLAARRRFNWKQIHC